MTPQSTNLIFFLLYYSFYLNIAHEHVKKNHVPCCRIGRILHVYQRDERAATGDQDTSAAHYARLMRVITARLFGPRNVSFGSPFDVRYVKATCATLFVTSRTRRRAIEAFVECTSK